MIDERASGEEIYPRATVWPGDGWLLRDLSRALVSPELGITETDRGGKEMNKGDGGGKYGTNAKYMTQSLYRVSAYAAKALCLISV